LYQQNPSLTIEHNRTSSGNHLSTASHSLDSAPIERAALTVDAWSEQEHRGQVGSNRCPQCGIELVAPNAFSSAWRCADHGEVLPFKAFSRCDQAAVDHVRRHAQVPLWMPDPLPTGWQLNGIAAVGDERSKLRATVAAFVGPAPLGGAGEWLFVAEEPGIGLGAAYARAAHHVHTAESAAAPPAKIHAEGHPTPLWCVPDSGSDRSAYVGEAEGVWLWLISFPGDAGYLFLEDVAIVDLRSRVTPIRPGNPQSTRLLPGT
jgi:hypothetical protein